VAVLPLAGNLLLALLAIVFWRRGVFDRAPWAAAAALSTAALLIGPPATGHAAAVPALLFLVAGTSEEG
jgi:hypothetical protein